MPADLERVRKWLHLAPGALAFAIRDLGPGGSLALTVLLLAFNLWLLPRFGGGALWRSAERARGEAPAIVFYPAALVILALAAWERPEVLAGAWGMLAFGDAAATLVGRRWGRRPLPWNRDKSWVGWLAFVGVSWLAVAVLVRWTVGSTVETASLVWVAALAAVAGATIESLPWRLDDNLGVTLLGGAVLWLALTLREAGWDVPRPGASVLVAAIALAGTAWRFGALDGRAALAAVAVALAVGVGGGLSALGLLAAFVAGSVAAGRLRRRLRGGLDAPRAPRQVLANGAVAAGCGLVAGLGTGAAVTAMAAALAAAASDTVGGEMGQAVGGSTWRITDGRAVEPGVDGGVSLAGTACSLAAAAGLAGLAVATDLLTPGAGLVVAAAGFGGGLLDSLLGATLERRGWLDNEGVNLLSTLAAAWGAAQGERWLLS